jgi:ABC-type multidrug transport system fused ATPase/permease subunit
MLPPPVHDDRVPQSLRLTNRARHAVSTGECVNLMSSDCQRLPDAAAAIHNLWISPLFVAVIVYLLVDLVGWSALCGLAVLLLTMPLQMRIAARQMRIQRAQSGRTDARLRLVNEVLQCIKVVKYCAWEASFEQRLDALRAVELESVRQFAFATAYSIVLVVATPLVMCGKLYLCCVSKGSPAL